MFAILEDRFPLPIWCKKTLATGILLKVCPFHPYTNPSPLQPMRTPLLHHPCHHLTPPAQGTTTLNQCSPTFIWLWPHCQSVLLVATLSHMCHLLHMSQVGEDDYTGLYFVPSCSPKHSFLHNGYIAQSPTCSLPVNQCIHKPEKGEVESKGHGRGLLVNMPVKVQGP